MTAEETAVRYRFGGSARTGVLLGLGMRQSLPLVAGCVWLTLCLMAGAPLVGFLGPVVGAVVSFGRWHRTALYDIAVPGVALVARRVRKRSVWRRCSLLTGPTDTDLPDALRGLRLLERDVDWTTSTVPVGIVHDHPVGTVSVVVPVTASGFAVSSAGEQDALIAGWASALGPFARAQCPVVRVVWQHWTHVAGMGEHRRFLAGLTRNGPPVVVDDYDALIDGQSPLSIGHDVLVTLTVDLRRVRTHRRDTLDAASTTLVEEARLFAGRLESAGARVGVPLSAVDVAHAVRARSDPARLARLDTLRRSLAAAVGKGTVEWGPMAVTGDWLAARVDGSWHRTFRVAVWPMLPVGADWLAPLLGVADATVLTTVVLEPVPLMQAAAQANRELTSLEADHAQKERHGFRLTARERRRQRDIEEREQELASGHPEFRHVGFVTVTAPTLDELDDTAALVEQAAAQSMLDLRPLTARQVEGWVCSLPLGRNIRRGAWS